MSLDSQSKEPGALPGCGTPKPDPKMVRESREAFKRGDTLTTAEYLKKLRGKK